MEKDEVKVENIVASVNLADKLDLDKINREAPENVEYEPEQFPGLVFRISDPKTATLLFRSGKANCTGAKSVEDVHIAVKKLIEKPKITIQNIVATYDLKTELNLNEVASHLGYENVEYEPEQFPGLVYRLDSPRLVVLLFGSGKIVCTGAKDVEGIRKGIDIIKE
ncbi:MAG: TATA-box-binding protein, partial [Candidatus Methanosuratincola petrocarbonis]